MCTATLSSSDQQIVEDIIETMVAKNEMFTAHEIGVKAKQEGATASPRELRHVAHELFGGQGQGASGAWFAQNNYERTLIDVGDSVRPWLYHPVGADISPYTKKFQTRQATTAPSQPASNPLGIAQPAALDDDDDEDSSPAAKPQSQTGVAATVALGNGQFQHIPLKQGTQAPTQPQSQTLKARQNPDKDGRVFVGGDCLRKLGLKEGDKVVLEGDGGNRIEIAKGNGTGDYTVNADMRIRIGKPKREKLGLTGDSFKIELDKSGTEPRLVVTKATNVN